jgi:flagellar basal body-associated protein FliL
MEANGIGPGHSVSDPYDYNARRSDELRRRNRLAGIIITIVIVVMVIATVIYVNWYGGTNMAPQAPLHSSIVVVTGDRG